jgi:hypothetical protein
MSRIVEVLVALNALGGIAAFLGFRVADRRARDRAAAEAAKPPEPEEQRALGRPKDEAGP